MSVPVRTLESIAWHPVADAGFRRVGESDMEPENPVDLPLHVISRTDRPGFLARVSR
ncbi:hypothetical protein QFZ46_002031 [Microbacterium murale]|uniref:Uncharacterized protein n=1 Tax=Microbacterium murale TaxID=1081040 RepID=A0ABU0PB07_9MICO|nr:hypothetical protein [Microbacterium murale]